MLEEGAPPEARALPRAKGPGRDDGDGVVAGAGGAVASRWGRLRARLGARLGPRLGPRLRAAAFAALGAAAIVTVAGELHLRPELFHRPGVTWRASTGGWSYPAQGTGAAVLGGAAFFHTVSEQGPWFEVDLGRVVPIESVEVTNRLDCCSTRALPLVVEVATEPGAWTEVARRRKNFITWEATFPERPARYVRLRVDAVSMLHLTDIAIR